MMTIRHPENFEENLDIERFHLDFSINNTIRLIFNDGYTTEITIDRNKFIRNDNDTEIEAVNYTPEGESCQFAWIGTKDEVQYVLYNWLMEIEKKTKNKYVLYYIPKKPVGGGFL